MGYFLVVITKWLDITDLLNYFLEQTPAK